LIMVFRDVSVQDLKKDYINRHGFFFQVDNTCNKDNCTKVASAIMYRKYCDIMPEFVSQINDKCFAFVYPDGCSFRSGDFFQDCKRLSMVVGNTIRIDMLNAVLMEN
jgi:hypothetical protein